jgi:UDP-glucose 6-dehydrogenase
MRETHAQRVIQMLREDNSRVSIFSPVKQSLPVLESFSPTKGGHVTASDFVVAYLKFATQFRFQQ